MAINISSDQLRWSRRAIAILLPIALAARLFLYVVTDRDGFGLKFNNTLGTVSIILFALFCFSRPVQLMLRGVPHPIRHIREDIRKNADWLAGSSVCYFLLADTLASATNIKKSIPEIIPFYADPYLADLDKYVLGVDAWQVTHAMFGTQVTYAISGVYTAWFFVNLGLALFICFDRSSALKLQAAMSFQLGWFLLGGCAALAFSSVGPCFYEYFYGDPRFTSLMETLPADLRQRKAMAYLLASQGTDSLGNGISAMPSLHVGIAFLAALFAQTRANRLWLRVALWVNVLITYIGSIHIGWHYASDGLFSVVGMFLIWKVCGLLVSKLFSGPFGQVLATPLNPSTRIAG